MRPAAALAVLVTLLIPSHATGETRVTPFTLRPPGDIVLPVTIAGQGPFRMLLDTGASRSAVTAAVAERVGSRHVGRTVMATPAGAAGRSLLLLEGVTVGAIGPQSVVGVQLEPVDLADVGVDGLIGQDLLSRVAFTIDYRAGTVAWHAGTGGRPPGTRIPVDFEHGRLLARVPGTAGWLRLVVDSGADRLVLFARAWERLGAVALGAVGTLRSTAGLRVVSAARVDRLQIGELSLDGVLAAVLPDASRHAGLEDGLLPLHLFKLVTVDAPARVLIVQNLPPPRSR